MRKTRPHTASTALPFTLLGVSPGVIARYLAGATPKVFYNPPRKIKDSLPTNNEGI